MSRQTTNYGLTKPDYTDTADIEVVNANMDIIDGALKVIDTKSNNVMSKNSSAWSSTVAYAVGQYCIYNNSLWKCLVQHSGQTPQEGTYWARVSLDTLGSEINALNNNLVNIKDLVEDEVQIGTWLGVPMYRKRLSGQLTTASMIIGSGLGTNNIQLIKSYGCILNISASSCMPVNSTLASQEWYNSIYQNQTDMYLFFGSNLNNGRYDVWIEYLKK